MRRIALLFSLIRFPSLTLNLRLYHLLNFCAVLSTQREKQIRIFAIVVQIFADMKQMPSLHHDQILLVGLELKIAEKDETIRVYCSFICRNGKFNAGITKKIRDYGA